MKIFCVHSVRVTIKNGICPFTFPPELRKKAGRLFTVPPDADFRVEHNYNRVRLDPVPAPCRYTSFAQWVVLKVSKSSIIFANIFSL